MPSSLNYLSSFGHCSYTALAGIEERLHSIGSADSSYYLRDDSQRSTRLACYLDIARHIRVVHISDRTLADSSLAVVGTGSGIAFAVAIVVDSLD